MSPCSTASTIPLLIGSTSYIEQVGGSLQIEDTLPTKLLATDVTDEIPSVLVGDSSLKNNLLLPQDMALQKSHRCI